MHQLMQGGEIPGAKAPGTVTRHIDAAVSTAEKGIRGGMSRGRGSTSPEEESEGQDETERDQ